MRTQNRESQADLTPAAALDLLKNGNTRFTENLRAHHDLLEQVNITSEGQYPFAVILSCIDSRASAELIFDQGLGDIFSVRVAGNVSNDDVLGSMEFACALAGAKLVVVLGHSSCGAVKGACDGAEMGHLTGLLSKIRPSVEEVRKLDGPALERDDFVQRVADLNVQSVVTEIRGRSRVLDSMINEGRVGIVGGMYSVSTGAVEFGELVCGEG
jgi:carbonic anhydrase